MTRTSPLAHLAALASLAFACAPRASTPAVDILPQIAPLRSRAETKPAVCGQPERLFRELRGPVRLEAYMGSGTPKRDALVGRMRDLFARWEATSSGKVTGTIVDPASSEEVESAGMAKGLVRDPSGEGTQALSGVLVQYGSREEAVKLLTPEQAPIAELLVLRKIREAVDADEGNKRRIGVVVGHGEIALSEANLLPSIAGQVPSIASILTQHFPQLELVDVDLARPVDAGLEAVLVTQPSKALSEAELRRLDAFVLTGKRLVVVASAVDVARSDAKMMGTPATHGLDRLLSGYGLQQQKDVVLEPTRGFRVSAMNVSGTLSTITIPSLLHVREDTSLTGEHALLDTSFGGFLSLPELSFPFVSSLVIRREAQPEATFRVHARSSPEAVRQTTFPVDLRYGKPPESPRGEAVIAASVSGTLKSAFGPERSKDRTRVLVISSSQFFANPLARAGSAPPHATPSMLPPSGDETLEQLSMVYAQQALTNTILAAKQTLIDWAAYDDDLSCLLER